MNATRWTTVTDDNTIVANLISLYLSWEHTIFRLFDEDYFLDQLAEGKTDYCSSLLVNALLAIATVSLSCPASRALEVYALLTTVPAELQIDRSPRDSRVIGTLL